MILNKRQKKAVNSSIDKNILVVSGPGTGKTIVIAERVKYLISKGVNLTEITVLAFTNNAAQEIGGRLNENVGAKTFSSWCLKALKNYSKGYKSKKLFDQENQEQQVFVKKLVEEQKLNLNVTILINIISYSKNKCVSVRHVIEQRFKYLAGYVYEIEKLVKNYEETKQKKALWDFDDLLTEFYKLLKNDKCFIKKSGLTCEYILVDEVQDMSIVQWKILRKITDQNVKVFCVGDSAQLIYQFRGASSKYLKRFKYKFNNSAQVRLKINYRSSPEIVELSNWLRKEIDPKYHVIEHVCEVQELPRFSNRVTLDKALESLVIKIGMLLRSGGEVNEIAILVRTNIQQLEVEKALTQSKIPIYQDKDKFGIRLMTMHKAKGGEFETVFVIDPRFNHSTLDTKAAELRILYVALTRAKNNLTIYSSIGGKAMFNDAISSDRYPLDIIPNELIEYST
jgi:DNA helicase-2/ATP-dependent DNA helicase PcrA